jgi:hypothetical protein
MGKQMPVYWIQPLPITYTSGHFQISHIHSYATDFINSNVIYYIMPMSNSYYNIWHLIFYHFFVQVFYYSLSFSSSSSTCEIQKDLSNQITMLITFAKFWSHFTKFLQLIINVTLWIQARTISCLIFLTKLQTWHTFLSL